MRIFVTGGTGFIGKAVVKLLVKQEHEVLILTRRHQNAAEGSTKGISYDFKDLRDTEGVGATIEKFRPQALVHLAWEGLPDYSLEMSGRNLQYGMDLFSLAAGAGCSCILSTGSCWEYTGRNGKLTEEDALESKTMFPAVKNALKFVGEAIAREKGISFYWLRLFYVYGPGQRKASLIPHIIQSVKKGRMPEIQTPGNRNDFIFVEDVARAIVRVLESLPENSVYNIGSGHSTAVRDVVRITCAVMNRAFDKKVFENLQQDAVHNFCADISSIENHTGWRPQYDIESGIRATVEHFGANL